MPERPNSAKEVAYYFELSQVGLEFVSPLVIGVVLDHYLAWGPWGVIIGAVLGLAVGMWHLVRLLNRQTDMTKPPQSQQDRR